MIHIVMLTTDGGDREDSSVYYANTLLVDDHGNLPLERDLADLFGCADPNELTFDAYDDDTADETFEDTDMAAAALRARGYTIIDHCVSIVTRMHD